MGRKRTGTRKFIYLCIVNLICSAFFGCAVLSERQKVAINKVAVDKVAVDDEESQKKEKTLKILSDRLLRARELLEQQDYDGSFKEYQEVLSLAGQNPPGDEALFNMGLIYAHSGNPKKDYGKSVGFLNKLTKSYPRSPFVAQARVWVGILQENEKLNQTIQKLNQMIEESKRVDIEIEEKKRERVK
jgi:tetratricopeptide (TPR) repeat protein